MASYHLTINNGKKGTAATHAAYIARQGKHNKNPGQSDLVALEHGNLPTWANGDPIYFFKMADAGERSNGAAYRELEFALPSELTREQQCELAGEFIRQKVGNKPFFLAIHSPTAALGGVAQTHGHGMYSDRMPDGIERPSELHFSRYNSAKPELGGCKKDSGGKDLASMRNVLKTYRADFANLQNQFLAKNGHSARVSHLSNRERGIDKEPERHLGAAAIKKMTDEDKAQIKDKRQKSKKQNA